MTGLLILKFAIVVCFVAGFWGAIETWREAPDGRSFRARVLYAACIFVWHFIGAAFLSVLAVFVLLGVNFVIFK